MAESKFLKYQDKDGNFLIDVCDEIVEVPEVPCEESQCFPSATAVVPNWQLSRNLSPFLNEKTCHYQVPVETPYTTTIEERLLEEPNLTEEEADGSLNDRFEEYLEEAVTAFLESYNKDDSEATRIVVRGAVVWDVSTDYYLEPRALSRLRLLYSLPYDVLHSLEDAEVESEDDDTEGSPIEVTYTINNLKTNLIHVRKALKMYSWYNKVYIKTDGSNLYYEAGPKEGAIFNLEDYGDFGIVNGSKMAKILPELDGFLNTKGYNITGVGKIGGFLKDKIIKVIFGFSEEYELIKLTVFSDGCAETPIIFEDKLDPLKREEPFNDSTAMAYLAQLDDMIVDLTAREPLPWLEFITKYTYPAVFSTINKGYTNTDPKDSVGSCVAGALVQEGKQLGEDILDEVFSIADAINYQFHKNLCSPAPDEILKEWGELGLIWNPDAQPAGAEPFKQVATQQAYETLCAEDQSLTVLCSQFDYSGGLMDADELWHKLLSEIKFCGMSDLLMGAIQCLFGGVSFEQAMATIIESALRGMSLENFDKLFIGLPPEKQAELEALAKKNLESGDIFKESSTLQQTSDALEGKLEIEKLWEDEEMLEAEKEAFGTFPTVTGGQVRFMWGDPEADEFTSADASRRTLAQQFDGSTLSGTTKASNNVLMEAWIQAYLELFSDVYLELLDYLNKLPGAQIVAYAIATLDCPVPPVLNPSVLDFIKDREAPFCANTFNIAFPKFVNPFDWYPDVKNPFRLYYQTALKVIQVARLKIIKMIMVKICEILGNAACSAAGALGASLGALASGDRSKIIDAIRDSICGDDVDSEQIDDTVVDMLSNLGLGAAALADTEQVLNFAGDISSAVTTEELYDAFLCEPSPAFLTIVKQILQYEYPDLAVVLKGEKDIKSFFCNMGNLMPAGFKDQMKNILEDYPGATQIASLCPTPEEIDQFCQLRGDILGDRASPEQIQQLCQPNDDLKDLSDLVQGGLPSLPPLVSDPGCDNGILPYESDEAVAVASVVLNNMLEQLKVDFTFDMLGNGPFEKKWGLVNMILSDTMGKPLTAHHRKASNWKPYVNFYMDQGALDELDDGSSGFSLSDIGDAMFPDPPLIKRQRGAFPTKVADWLEEYLDGKLEPTFISNNEFFMSMPFLTTLKKSGIWKFRGGINRLRLDEKTLGYNTSIKIEGDTVTFTEEARKLTPDFTLEFKDNCKGLQADPSEPMAGDAYLNGFNLEFYLSELVSDDGTIGLAHNLGSQPAQPWAVTSINDAHAHTYTVDLDNDGMTSYTDGHEHEIKSGVVQEADGHTHRLEGVAFSPEFTSLPRDTSRVKIVDIPNDAANIGTLLASLIPVIRTPLGDVNSELQEKLTPKNSSADEIPLWDVKYEFLSIDNTLDGINFDDYPNFVSTFRSYQEYLPQVILLKEMLGSTISSADLQSAYDAIMQELLKKFIGEVAGNLDSFEYGAVFDDLTYDDALYVIAEDLSEEDGYATDYDAGTNYYDVRVAVPMTDPSYYFWINTIYLGNRPLLPKDQIMGISNMQYKIDSGADDRENRIFYLDPLEYGGSYVNPPIHIKPLQNKGWMGFVDVMFPDISPCKPSSTDLIDFEDIQKKMNDAYPNIPEDPRLQEDPDCVVEVPYNRILDRVAAAGLEGLIPAAIRIYVSTNLIKSMSTFTKFKPNFPDVFSSAFASYVIEDMKASFKDPSIGIFELNQFSLPNTEFWYAFLEQAVQLYGRKVDSGDIFEPPESVIEALNRLNDMQEIYEYPDKEELKEERGYEAGLFETLKHYRNSRNYEAIQATEQDAKLILKELVMEQLNYMGEKFAKNLEIIGMTPDVYDLDYYLLQYLAQGGEGLTLNQEIVETYTDLHVVPYEDNPAVTDPYYTYGAEFATPDGSGYVGYYHVAIDEESGIPMYLTGEADSGADYEDLTPFANKIEVNIGDIESYPVSHEASTEQPFIIEKYIRINGSINPANDGTLNSIKNAGTADQNISDIYPGTLELVSDVNGQVVGLTGELGLRYGLRFSVIINGGAHVITEVEVDSLDLKLSQVDPFAKNSKLLLCLINMLKEDEKFRLVAHYIFPLSKLTSAIAIYNSEAFLPSIGEKVTPIGDVFSSKMSEKPGMSVTVTEDEDDPDSYSISYGQDPGEAMAALFEKETRKLFEDNGWEYLLDNSDLVERSGGRDSSLADMAEDIANGTLTDFDDNYIIPPLDSGADKIPLSDLISTYDTMPAGWAHKVDRDHGLPTPFILEWDDWDGTLLRNSKMRIKKIFKNYYNSRTWTAGGADDSFGGLGDSPGVIITKEFREKFKVASGARILPRWKKRMLRTNPFNEDGELCESSD